MKKLKTWMCAKCFSADDGPMEFKDFEAYSEHNKSVHSGTDVAPVEQKPVTAPVVEEVKPEAPPKEPLPLELKYKYDGACHKCGKEVDTIVLDMDKKTRCWVIAWCSGC